VRVARLTQAGRRERAVLEERSDELARAVLAPLRPAQRAELVESMARVERLMTAGLVDVGEVDPRHPDAVACLEHYFAELDRRFAIGYDPSRALPVDPDEVRPPSGVMLVARLRGEPIGCGGLKRHPGWAELKRLWVAPGVRGLGLGRRLLTDLEHRAAAQGAAEVRLDTNSALHEATALYRACGYLEVPAFNDEPHADLWFAKPLGRPTVPPVAGASR
jgi:GNAT superfamily N-acetyltransferase